jgi:hypothetical protein
MDAVAALTAPLLVDLDVGGLTDFMGKRGVRVLHAHDGAPFGALLKGLLHGRLGSELRCGRLALDTVDPDVDRTFLGPMTDLAGTHGVFPPPAGYYLFRGPHLVGYHPGLDGGDRMDLLESYARAGARGLRSLLAERDPSRAGRAAIDGRPELDVVRFFEDAAQGWTPRRAPKAPERRERRDRRGGVRGGRARRAGEQVLAELDAACQLLGVTPDMPLRQIKAARNRLMRANHPDRLVHAPQRAAEATRLTVQINEAWSVIRRAWDERRVDSL